MAVTSRGSAGSAQNYQRLVSTFGPSSTSVTDRAPFVAKDVLDKVLLLSALAVGAGTVTAVAKPSQGVMWLAFIVAIGTGLAGLFMPRHAKVLALVYALSMGSVLGWISYFYAENDNAGAVPLAILGTTGIFLGVLALYRSGLVRVTNRFIQVTLVATLGLFGAMIAVLLGIHIPHASQSATYLVVFGFLYLFVAIMNLFVDFNFVYKAESAGVSKDGEWFAALSIMFSVVMVYLALLRILGNRR